MIVKINNKGRWRNILQRIITGAVALILFIPVLFFSGYFIFDVTMAVISVMALYELLSCVNMIRKYIVSIPALAVTFVVPLLYRNYEPQTVIFIMILLLFYLLYVMVFTNKKYTFNDIALVYFSAAYITVSVISVLIIRSLEFGEYLYLLIFIGAWVTDTFAYFTGKLLGRTKLVPKISPNKTVEGAVGGMVFCAAAFVVYGIIVIKLRDSDIEPNYLVLAAIGLAVSAFAQIGDFSASAIKRQYDKKDFGSVFPGHGGILDRFDSVLGVAPVLMIILSALLKVTNIGLFL